MSEVHSEWSYAASDLDALAEELDRLSPEARDPWDLMQRLTGAHLGPDLSGTRSSLVIMTERAFAHTLEDDPDRFGASKMGRRFSSPAGEWPPGYDAVDHREKTFWVDLGSRVTHELPKTHIEDVTLAAGAVTALLPVAQRAVEGYLQLAEVASLDPYYRAQCLRRALTLSRHFLLPEEPHIRERLFGMALGAVASSLVPTYVLFQCLEPLAVKPRTGNFLNPDKGQIRALIDAIELGPGDQILDLEAIYGVREELAEDEGELETARRSLLQGYLEVAEQSEGLARLHWLQQSASMAQKFGLTDIRGTAITKIQETSVTDLGMRAITTEFSAPRNVLDSRMARYRRARTALQALDIWLATPAPTGSYEVNQREATAASGRGILQAMSRVTVDSEGMPLRSSSGPAEAATEELERREGYYARAHGIVLDREMTAIRSEFGLVCAQEIGTHLATKYRCDLQKATDFGDAVVSYWAGRYGDAARASYPLMEAGVRGLLFNSRRTSLPVGDWASRGSIPIAGDLCRTPRISRF